MVNLIDQRTNKDKLWELYLHTLAGYHANIGANKSGETKIAEKSLVAAKEALIVWEKQ